MKTISTFTVSLPPSHDNWEVFFSGQKLYGDDFGLAELRQWYEDEKEGFASLPRSDSTGSEYLYHKLNEITAYNHLPSDKVFRSVLGVGSAFGEEFLPLQGRIDRLTILDPSDKFERPTIHGIPVKYVKPDPSGVMPFADESFDLVTCFGALHHIANVSFVLCEIYRVLQSCGHALIREPITSMGDWRMDRKNKGLTRRERGIPRQLFDKMITGAGFSLCHSQEMDFPILTKLTRDLGINLFNYSPLTKFDIMLCRLFAFNTKYHRTNFFAKLGPAAISYILRKSERAKTISIEYKGEY